MKAHYNNWNEAIPALHMYLIQASEKSIMPCTAVLILSHLFLGLLLKHDILYKIKRVKDLNIF